MIPRTRVTLQCYPGTRVTLQCYPQWRIQGATGDHAPQTVDKFFYTLSIPIIDGLYDECSHQNSLNLYLNSQKAFASGGLRLPDPLPSVSL